MAVAVIRAQKTHGANCDRSLVQSAPAAEEARSASTDVAGIDIK